MNELAKAYAKAFGKMQDAVKNSNNPHLGNDYANLQSVLDAVRPVLREHDLAIYQGPGKLIPVAPDVFVVSVISVLMHASGQQMAVETQVPVVPEYNKKSGTSRITAQGYGSAVSYARRYALQSICGITQVDDDGEAASSGGGAPEVTGPAAGGNDDLVASLRATKTLAELDEFKAAVMELGDRDVAKVYREQRKALKEAA